MPSFGSRNTLGLKPTTPQNAAGRMTDPFVCDPTAAQRTTAAAEPIDDPPGVCAVFHGLRVAPGVMNASSVVTVLPRTTAPAASSATTAVAERCGTRPR